MCTVASIIMGLVILYGESIRTWLADQSTSENKFPYGCCLWYGQYWIEKVQLLCALLMLLIDEPCNSCTKTTPEQAKNDPCCILHGCYPTTNPHLLLWLKLVTSAREHLWFCTALLFRHLVQIPRKTVFLSCLKTKQVWVSNMVILTEKISV